MYQDLERDSALLKSKFLQRKRQSIKSANNSIISLNKLELINFSNNDYLGLSKNKLITESIIDGLNEYGNGASASHLISGHYQIHDELESFAAKLVGFDRSLIFSSGYSANIGVIPSICGKGDVIFSDKLNHASLNEACTLSHAKFLRFAHNDMSNLEHLLMQQSSNRKIIVSDAVFSMDGNIANIPKILELCAKYNAYLYLDDAHGYGVLGKTGQGVIEYFEEKGLIKSDSRERIIYMFTLGKSVGVSGAIVAGNNELIKYLINKAKSYIYTTAHPPFLAKGIITSLEIIREGEGLRNHLSCLIKIFRNKIKEKIVLGESTTPIQPIFINDTEKTISIAKGLYELGFYVPSIRPPTVPEKTSRLRVSLSVAHKEKDVIELANAINGLLI